MAYRASLKLCLAQMAYQFGIGNYESLVITRCTRGKYYTCWVPHEFEAILATPEADAHSIVLMCTKRELKAITQADQQDLFDKENYASPTTDIPPGEQSSNQPPDPTPRTD